MGGYIGATAVGLVTTAADVDGDANIEGNLTVKGTTITVDSATAQTVDLGDNDKIRLGDGDDLQIYHDGSRSIIQDSGTGNLRIQANNLELNNADNSENYLFAAANGAVELYYDNAKKIETTSSGVDISGGLVCSPNTAGKDTFQLSTNAVDEGRLRIKNVDTTTVQVRAGGESYFNGGNIGIGTSSPTADLSIVDATTGSGMEFQPEVTTDTNRLTNFDRVESAYKKFRLDASEQQFNISGTEKMRIDSSGRLLVGKTVTTFSVAGCRLDPIGNVEIIRAGGVPLSVNRTSTDGKGIRVYKDGTECGSLETRNGNALVISTNNGSGINFGSSSLNPWYQGAITDNTTDIGQSAHRYDDIFATNGTIQTSDRNEKQDIEDLSEAELRVATAAKGLIKKYRWIDAVDKKGDDARIHVGIIAQDLQAAFEAEGLDAGRYAMFISDTWWEADRVVPAVEANEEEGIEAVAEHTVTDTFDTQEEAPEGATERTRLGVRYPELLAFIIGAM